MGKEYIRDTNVVGNIPFPYRAVAWEDYEHVADFSVSTGLYYTSADSYSAVIDTAHALQSAKSVKLTVGSAIPDIGMGARIIQRMAIDKARKIEARMHYYYGLGNANLDDKVYFGAYLQHPTKDIRNYFHIRYQTTTGVIEIRTGSNEWAVLTTIGTAAWGMWIPVTLLCNAVTGIIEEIRIGSAIARNTAIKSYTAVKTFIDSQLIVDAELGSVAQSVYWFDNLFIRIVE